MTKTDQYARHEILHMSLFLSGAVHEQITSQPLIEANPEWRALAEQAETALSELYQAIGAAHLKDT